jgi:predicted kinase
MKNLILMMGVTCSGKTTHVKKNLSGMQYVSEKAIAKSMVKENILIKDNIDLLYTFVGIITRSHMIQGRDIVIDDKNLNIQALTIWWKLAKEYGYYITVVLIDTQYEVCLDRLKAITNDKDAEKALFEEFSKLRDLKHILFSKYHAPELFDDIKVIEHN